MVDRMTYKWEADMSCGHETGNRGVPKREIPAVGDRMWCPEHREVEVRHIRWRSL
jgi:hypothetical protein